MTDPADERLRRLLGGDHLASLRKRLRRRFELAPLDDAVGSFRIVNLTVPEHAALASLLGRLPRYANSLEVDVRLVDAAFRNSGVACSLYDALERLDGPIVNLARERLQSQAAWSAAVNGCNHPGLSKLLENPMGLGLLKRLAKREPSAAGQLCRRSEAVLQRLPANGITRSQLAAEVLGDAHALDSGRATATLVLAVCRQAEAPLTYDQDDESADQPADDEGQSAGSDRDRGVWAKVGVLVNELARPVLFLNLPTRETKGPGRPHGEPAYASLRLLLRSPPAWDVADRKVYVCENANLLAIAADRWGSSCAPMVCTDGMPAAAQRCLLSQLAAARARLLYHGDFDWPGIHIGNHVIREHGAQPWHFQAADYQAALRVAVGEPLAGKAADAIWDPALTKVMQHHQVAIAEEALAAWLLPDLNDG
jgi:uncharacterized protein (TIGR02679 family)